MKEIKHLFFTYRNGAVADTLRRYGIPHKVIFGLEIPRLAEIARGLEASEELADRLWADNEVRESRLLATYLYSPTTISEDKVIKLASEVRTQEEADMLAFRLLKRMANAEQILNKLKSIPECSKTAEALQRHLS